MMLRYCTSIQPHVGASHGNKHWKEVAMAPAFKVGPGGPPITIIQKVC